MYTRVYAYAACLAFITRHFHHLPCPISDGTFMMRCFIAIGILLSRRKLSLLGRESQSILSKQSCLRITFWLLVLPQCIWRIQNVSVIIMPLNQGKHTYNSLLSCFLHRGGGREWLYNKKKAHLLCAVIASTCGQGLQFFM